MTYDIALRKLNSMEKLAQLKDDSLILLIDQLLDSESKEDWAESLTDAQMKSIKQGLKDISEGNTESYDDFKKRID